MSANRCKKTIEWEIIPTQTRAVDIEIEEVEAIEEPMPQLAFKKEVVIYVDPAKLGAAISLAAVPVGGVTIVVLYFETIILVLKWIAIGIVSVVGLGLLVISLAKVLEGLARHRQDRRKRQHVKHPGWSTGSRQRQETTVMQKAETIINYFN